jgi:hypothetical protein
MPTSIANAATDKLAAMPLRWFRSLNLHLLIVVALGAIGCPDSTPPRTGLEPSSPVSAPAPSTAGPDEKRYAGTYVYAGTDAERAGIEKAVDHATEGMVGKNIARAELMKRSDVRPTYTLRFDGKGNVAVETPGYPSEVNSLDGPELQFKNKYGDVLQNRQRFVGGDLLQESRTSDGGGSTRFALQPDGKTLIVTRVSQSPKLPRTVAFSLTYTRQPGTP